MALDGTGVDFERVTVRDVSRHFGRRRALSQISLTCQAGEIVGLLGHNGAGKSTLLAILATLLRPSSGEVLYGSTTAAADGAGIRARLGLLGHELQLYPELTAVENLRFFGGLYGLSHLEARVRRALDVAGLRERADEPLTGFSRGMRQRLALERALLHDPRLLLLDEPFTGLDQASTSALVERLGRLAADGRIIVLATHDLALVDGVLTRAAILRDGRLAALHEGGTGLRERYADAARAGGGVRA